MREIGRLKVSDDASFRAFVRDVRNGLAEAPRQLPSRYLYDSLGSSLFDAICRLPWYKVTRAETRLLQRHACEVRTLAGAVTRIVELGPGNGEKLETLLDSGGPCAGRLEVHLVDVSASALQMASQRIGIRQRVRVAEHEATYEEGLVDATAGSQGPGQTLALFLGSNIGNFDRPAADDLLRHVREALSLRDAFLLGVDLIKPERDLLEAYDDPLGVTAAFNKNVLCRLNRELGADFDLSRFSHRAVWNADEARVEMHLVSLIQQDVKVAAAGLEFTLAEGETIWTESSYKFDRGDVIERLESVGFGITKQWVDEGAGFALTLASAQ